MKNVPLTAFKIYNDDKVIEISNEDKLVEKQISVITKNIHAKSIQKIYVNF